MDDSDSHTGDSAVEDSEFPYSQIPEEIRDALVPLSEPDFLKALEELASESCGYLFTAEAVVDSPKESYTILETRAFDEGGHLIAAEIQVPERPDLIHEPPLLFNRRLQIDYDSSKRPILVRLGPMFEGLTNESKGSVIRIEYQSDGSSRSRYVTNETQQIRARTDACYYRMVPRMVPSTEQPYFCEQLRFNPNNNLLDRTWDCIDPTVVHSRDYDDQERVISDRGNFIYESPEHRPIPQNWLDRIQTGEWQIGYQYDDAINSDTITWKWNRSDLFNGCIRLSTDGIYGQLQSYDEQWYGELEDGVENRLVRTFDETGQRLLFIDYDYRNDGDFDERVTYTYQDDDLSSKELDRFRDGIADIVEIHNRSPNGHRIERRSMTAAVGLSLPVRVDDFRASFVSPSSTLPPQSQAVTQIQFDERSRPIATDLEIQWLYEYLPYESDVPQQTLVSESWHQTSQYADLGYVKENTIVWEPSDALLEVQARDSNRDQSIGNPPELFESFANTTTCSITPFCQNEEIALPEQMRLLSCEVAFIFPEYQNIVQIPSITGDDYTYVVPPYDSVPGIKNLLKRITRSDEIYIYGFPIPPNARDIIDY